LVAKTSKYTILIVILSVLLAISLIVGSTFAWFVSSDTASSSIVLGDPVELNIVDLNNQIITGDNKNLPIIIPGNKLLPGMPINVLARVLFTQSNTPALLRAQVNVSVLNVPEDPENQEEIDNQTDALLEALNDSLAGSVDANWVYSSTDQWWYYIGSNAIETNILETVVYRIDNESEYEADRRVTFMSGSFIFPYFVGNLFSNADIKFEVEFQAIQGYLPAYEDALLQGENEFPYTGFRYNKIKNVVDVFNEAFS
jgi:predicted ribosomally synthesized peptide with SipW-like signal peptide